MLPTPNLFITTRNGNIVVEPIIVLLVVPVSYPKSNKFPYCSPILSVKVGQQLVFFFPQFLLEFIPKLTLYYLKDYFPLSQYPTRQNRGVTLLLCVLDTLIPN